MADQCANYQVELEISAKQLGVDLQSRLKALTDKYQQEAHELEDQAPDPNAVEGAVDFEFDIDWKDVDIIFDLPEFTMKTQEWILDLPQVTMRDKEMIFHTPSTRMVTKKVGQYPEFHGFEVVWKDILIDVPEGFMQEQRIVMGLPEIRVDRTSMSLDIPEVTMKTQHITMGLPQFTLKSISGEISAVKQDAEGLKNRANTEINSLRSKIASDAAGDITKKCNSLFTCLRTSIQMKKDQSLAMVDPAITMIQQSISKLSSIDSDESRAAAADLQTKLADTIARKSEIEKRFSAAIDGLIEQEQVTVHQILGRLASVG